MNILQRLTTAAILGITVTGGTGCDDIKVGKNPERKALTLSEKNSRELELTKEVRKISYPLKDLRAYTDGIHNFDKNKNEVLDPDEIDLFIKLILNKDGKYTEKGLEKLKEVISNIATKGNKDLSNELKEKIFSRCNHSRETYRPDNIKETITNLKNKSEEYSEGLLDQKDKEVNTLIENSLKATSK